MGNRKIIIIAVIVLAIVGVAAFFIQRNSKKVAQNTGQNNGNTTGTGGLNNLPTGTTNQGRGGFQVISDPTQPFATTKPRDKENAADNTYKPKTTTGGNTGGSTGGNNTPELTYQQQYDLGLVPDANGYYRQLVNASGINQAMANDFADYSLSDEDFMNKYYPDYLAYNAGQTPEQIAQNAKDPVVIDNPADSMVDVASVSDSSLKISSSNSQAAYGNYLQQISDAASSFDLVYNDGLITEVIDLNSAQITDRQNKAQAVVNKILAISVPSNMKNLSKAYLTLYGSYGNLLNDAREIIRSGGKPSNAVMDQFATDAQNLSDALDTANTNINSAKALYQQ